MKSRTASLAVAAGLIFGVSLDAAGAGARSAVPFGHAGWMPSPTDPVGFAGRWNNWYPGAAPPTEWSDSPAGGSKNIRWRVPIPGWTDAQPLVVGSRVIGVYSPHHVVCFDAGTGSVLWRDELKAMWLPTLAADGVSLEPPPDPARAAKLQDLFERGLAAYRILFSASAHNGSVPTARLAAERKPLIAYVAATLESWKAEVGRDWPGAIGPLDADLALYRLLASGQHEEYDRVTNGRRRTPTNFTEYARSQTGIWPYNNWQGSISDAMAGPVSDGEIVGVTFGFGQAAAYEVATGRRLWAWRDPRCSAGAADHCASPLLWKEMLLLPGPGSGAGTNSGGVFRSMRGVSKRTGAVCWETDAAARNRKPWGAPWSHGDHMSPILVRLPAAGAAAGEAGERPVVVTNTGQVLDPETGAVLAQLPNSADPALERRIAWGAGFLAAVGGTVYRGWGAENNEQFVQMWALRSAGAGRVEVSASRAGEVKAGLEPMALSDRVLAVAGGIAGLDGRLLYRHAARVASPALIGRFLYAPMETSWLGCTEAADGVAAMTVRVWDVADPASPKPVSAGNRIEAAGYTPDITGKYFPRFAQEKDLRKWAAEKTGYYNYQGIGYNFALGTGGLTARGGRLYLHAPGLLYCIGAE